MNRTGGTEAGSRWVSYHLFYHASLDLLLLELVLPVLRELWSRNRLRHFFYIRYPLGGPHIRLRFFGGPADLEEAAGVLARQAADFFARWPSTTPVDESVIRERNRLLLEHDPEEIDAVYPDNSFAELPFRPEVERYGGEALIERSLELFSLSSASTLALLESNASEERPRLLGAAMQILLRQALGFAADGEELTRLVSYPIHSGAGPSLVTHRADREFERQPESYVQLLSEEIESSFT
ncbi:MAG: lantibiotic dehydratase C-terminal domain-containing protein, partial [Thermoanaerobaculia bacterium]